MATPEPPARPGEISGPEMLIEAHRHQLLSWIDRSMSPALRGKVEPDDILQEVAIAAVKNREQFLVPGRDPLRFLCQLAEQRIVDAYRYHIGARKRSVYREAMDQPPDGDGDSVIDLLVASITSPSAVFSRNQKEMQLRIALEQLTEDQRAAVRLRFVDGLPTREIAERLGKSDGAVRVLLSRSITQLQEHLTDS